MLKMKRHCENCYRPLPPNSIEAMICSYECTYCKDYVTEVFNDCCPNCGGSLEKRPRREQ
ncbi:MAG: DUF1272 domain-containing protein [Flavobacteriaceae bacterium]|nr:DUF1272 domain-containing protein [Flavobacteriaceae bacterium]